VPAIARVGHETTKTGELKWNHPNWRKRSTRAMASVRTPRVTPGLTCEGVRLAALAVESDRHARGYDIRQEKTVRRLRVRDY
jgi:hypothetical protein